MRPALLLPTLLASTAAAQVAPDAAPDATLVQPAFVRATALAARIDASGPRVAVELELTLANAGGSEGGFELFLPLRTPDQVTGVELASDGGTVEGRAYDADEARALYRELVRDRHDLALLEHWGEPAFRVRVEGIPAQGTRVVTLRYQSLLVPAGDLQRFSLPLSALRAAAAPLALSISGELRAAHPITTLYSPTHALDSDGPWEEWDAARVASYRTSFAAAEPASSCDADFVFYSKSRPVEKEAALLDVTLLSERPEPGQDGYFLALVNGVPGHALEPQPKNVVFVLDHSGSMKGPKIEQARAALLYLAQKLRPEDRFNLVAYSAQAKLFADVLQGPTPRALEELGRHVAGIEAEGGTNIGAALALALAQFDDGPTLDQVVFLTDGLPTEGETDPSRLAALVRASNAHGARVVAFGVGFDVNGILLDRLAAESRGLSEYVLPGESIEEKVPGFYERMHSPLVLDAAFAFEGGGVHDVFPRVPGDVYGGHQLLLVGRYAQAGRTLLRVSGRRGAQDLALAFPLELAADTRATEQDHVARIWAAKKIGYLVDDIRISGESEEAVRAIVELGTRFGILTEYSAFLAAEATNLYALDANIEACKSELDAKTGVASGSHGVAQASNSKLMQRSGQAQTMNCWLDEQGNSVAIAGVQNVKGCTLFKRGDTWLDARVASLRAPADGEPPADEVELLGDEFYALLDRHPWVGACVARTGDVTLRIDGKNLRIKG